MNILNGNVLWFIKLIFITQTKKHYKNLYFIGVE